MTPTQADREAAEAVYAAMTKQFEAEGNVVTRSHAVTPDDDKLVQAFAHHRLAAEAAAFEKAAGVAEATFAEPGWPPNYSLAGLTIATAIRKLAGEKQ